MDTIREEIRQKCDEIIQTYSDNSWPEDVVLITVKKIRRLTEETD